MMHEPQSFEMEITHADGKVVKMNVQTGGGPADEKFVQDHFRIHHPDARSIVVKRAARDLSADAAAVARAHGQTKLADHLAEPAPAPAPAQPRPQSAAAPAAPATAK